MIYISRTYHTHVCACSRLSPPAPPGCGYADYAFIDHAELPQTTGWCRPNICLPTVQSVRLPLRGAPLLAPLAFNNKNLCAVMSRTSNDLHTPDSWERRHQVPACRGPPPSQIMGDAQSGLSKGAVGNLEGPTVDGCLTVVSPS
jgi:hypothetical protein